MSVSNLVVNLISHVKTVPKIMISNPVGSSGENFKFTNPVPKINEHIPKIQCTHM